MESLAWNAGGAFVTQLKKITMTFLNKRLFQYLVFGGMAQCRSPCHYPLYPLCNALRLLVLSGIGTGLGHLIIILCIRTASFGGKLSSGNSIISIMLLRFSLKPVQMSSPVETRTCSATLTMVICSVASMICLIQGMLLFDDARAQRPLALVGMTINLIGGIWYTMSQVGVNAPEAKSANEDTEDSCSNRYT